MSTNSQNRDRSRSHSPSRSQDTDASGKYEEIPKEFICPVSKRFMSDPVTIPTSDLTYDRDSVKDLHKPEDVQPDLIMRKKMEEWLSHYDLEPFFNVEEDNVTAAFRSVQKERKVGLLHDFTKMMKAKPWLLNNGGAIWFAAWIISSYPNASATWITAALSLVTDLQDAYLQVPSGIRLFHDYSVLEPISKACEFECENQEFQKGFVNIMHALATNQKTSGVPPAMVGKLQKGIIETLVSYIWPVRENFIPSRYYPKLLETLSRLSESKEFCVRTIDTKIIEMLFILMDFGISSIPEIRDNPDKLSASLALGEFDQYLATTTSVKILDRLCLCSKEACARIGQSTGGELTVLNRAMNIFTEVVNDGDSFSACQRILGHYHGNAGNILTGVFTNASNLHRVS